MYKLLVDTSALKSILLKLPNLADCEVSARLVISCLSGVRHIAAAIIVFGLKGISRWSIEISQQLSSHCSWLKRQQSCLSNGQGVSSYNTRYQLTRLVFVQVQSGLAQWFSPEFAGCLSAKGMENTLVCSTFYEYATPSPPLLVGYQGQRPTGLS